MSRNATGFYQPQAQSTYWGTYDDIAHSTPTLNVFERLWMAWYAFMQNDVLATGIMSFVMHESVYFGRSLPWFIMDRMTSMRKYKIQNVCHVHGREMKLLGIIS